STWTECEAGRSSRPETRPTVRIRSGRQRGCRLFGGLSTNGSVRYAAVLFGLIRLNIYGWLDVRKASQAELRGEALFLA
ncbi:MAG: hypothetical protein MN733_42360, partial [Nitrososphaera sp.]|nr:hypothetical protein [Nitrososphaera sp.]